MDTQQVSDYLGVHEKQVYTLIHDRGLPATRITGKWIFPRHLVDRWLESNVINMPEAHSFLEAARDLLLIAGSDDPLLVRLTGAFRERTPDTVVLHSRAGSVDGLAALKKGLVHIACLHLMDPEGGYVTDHIRDYLDQDIAIVTFAGRTQGVILAPDNPLSVGGLSDAFTRVPRWAVRAVGTGTRALMEMELDHLGLDADPVLSGGIQVQSHLDAALAVLTGKADAAFGIEAAARLAGCHFIPVRHERFDMVVRRENFFLPQVQGLLGLLKEGGFKSMAASMGGYDLKETGEMRG